MHVHVHCTTPPTLFRISYIIHLWVLLYAWCLIILSLCCLIRINIVSIFYNGLMNLLLFKHFYLVSVTRTELLCVKLVTLRNWKSWSKPPPSFMRMGFYFTLTTAVYSVISTFLTLSGSAPPLPKSSQFNRRTLFNEWVRSECLIMTLVLSCAIAW